MAYVIVVGAGIVVGNAVTVTLLDVVQEPLFAVRVMVPTALLLGVILIDCPVPLVGDQPEPLTAH